MSDEQRSTTTPMGGLIGWFVNNHVAANILMMFLVIGGIISVATMRTETFPTIDPMLITVRVTYPGATPYEIADSITRRVEEELVGIEGVERISSIASEGVGIVRVEMEDFANSDDVYNEVETGVNSLIDFPPERAERPVITKVKPTPNVLTLALHGEVEERTLKHWAERIEDEIRQLNDVSLTEVRGIRDYQISVDISEQALRKYGLSFQNVSDAINAFSNDIPAGTIEAEQGQVLLRVQERRYTGPEFEKIVVRTLQDGSRVLLRDVAKVVDGFDDINLISRFNGERAAFIDVRRSETSDTLKVAESTKNYLDTLQLPTGLNLTIAQDDTISLKDRMSLMLRNGIIGFMLVFLILLLFLDLKLAFWTSAAIPISFLGGLMILAAFGYSINMITLFALIVVLGIVVDDGIVTGESIFDAQKEHPNDPNAVTIGVKNVLAPVTIGVLTTMAAFGPLIFSTGILGQIVAVIPAVVICILFVSLIEAYFILPVHLSNDKRWSRGPLSRLRNTVAKGLELFIEHMLVPFAKLCMKWRYATIAIFFGIAVITVGLMQSGVVRFIFFPQVEADYITINITMPIETPFETTQEVVNEIEREIEEVRKEIDGGSRDDTELSVYESVLVTIGAVAGATSGPAAGVGGDNGSHVAQVKVQLIPSDFREAGAATIEKMIRERIDDIAGIESLEFQSSLVGDEPDIEVELSHPDESMLNEAAEVLKKRLKEINGTTEVTDTFKEGKPEYVFKLNAQGLSLGLTPIELGQQLRAAYFGQEVQRYQRGRSEMIVYVRYPKAQREQLATLEQTRIRLQDGREVPLASVADIVKQRGYSQIETVNGRRIVSVTSDVDTTITTPNAVIAVMNETMLPQLKQEFGQLKASFEGESKEQQKDLQSLARNMGIALLIIFVLLGSQLRSYSQPFIIMTAIPFGVVGAILGHFVLGYDFTFISLFGVVALTGVVINDSIVLMDYFNKQRHNGMSSYDSAVKAIARRFRPILLTTLSTSLGLLPILMETSIQAKFLIPMVVSLAMGILFATFVILLFIPCLLIVNDDIKKLGCRLLNESF